MKTIIGLAFGVAIVQMAGATTINLTTDGSSGSLSGAFFQQVPNQTTGTGVIEPFVRIQGTDTEEGFNTSVKSQELDLVAGGGQQWNHDLQLSDVPQVKLNDGKLYYQFLLDINQVNNKALLSLFKLELWIKDTPITSFAGAKGVYADLSGSGAVKKWELGSGNVIELNYDLNSGSGAGDMFAYIPVDVLGADPTKWLYLYSAFGVPSPSNDGFEEWAIVKNASIPDGGATLALLGVALTGLGMIRRKIKI